MRSRRRHLQALCDLVQRELRLGEEPGRELVERCRDGYLASLGADDGLVVLQITAHEIAAATDARRPVPPPRRCERCGARLAAKRHRCSRCGLATR